MLTVLHTESLLLSFSLFPPWFPSSIWHNLTPVATTWHEINRHQGRGVIVHDQTHAESKPAPCNVGFIDIVVGANATGYLKEE